MNDNYPADSHGPSTVGRVWTPEVIDLRGLDSLAAKPSASPGVRVRIDRHVSPLDAMSPQQRKRLYVRVLCELVAYGETAEQAPATSAPPADAWSPTLTTF